MRTTFLTLLLCVFSFVTFAFMPAESNSSSEKATTSDSKITVNKTTEATATPSKTITSKDIKEAFEANKANMTFKEKLATKLITKKLAKIEKKQKKNPDATKMDSGLTSLLRILGVLLIVLGVVSIIFLNLYGGIVTIIVGIFLYLLPTLI